MKKYLLLFAIFCGLVANSSALTFVVGGVNYNVVSAVSPYTVEVIAKAPIYTGAVTIPAQVINGATTYSVVRIGQQAFQNCVGLTSVTMPNSVTDINLSAFAGCTALTNVVLSTALVNIRGYAFTGCSSLAQINFPANLLVIDSYAFRGCSSLTTVTIPAMVATMGVATFAKCAKLTSFTVSANNYFFKSVNGAILSKNGTTLVQCPTGISSFVIPTGVTKLANFSLSESPNLQTVFIPSSVASIGESAFSNCTLLDSIDCNVTTPPVVANANAFLNLPQNAALLVPSASVNAYKAATHWKSFVNIKVIKLSSHIYNGIKYSVLPNTNNVEVVANTAEYDYADDIIIPETIYFNDQNYTVTKIGNSAFNDNDSFRSITMPNTVTEIGRYAFFQCINIVTVQLSTSLQKIGEGAFMRCYSMENITALPASLKEIGRVSFANCSRLTTLTIPKGTTTIGAAAFSGGKKLNDLVLENGNAAYKQVDEAIFTINEDTLMYVPSGKTSYTIPHTVKCINDAAFSSCSLLTSITIPSTVQNIGVNAFEYCNGLIEITIPPTLTKISGGMYLGCENLTTIHFPDNLKSIEDLAFYGCSSLKSITIPSGVTSIDYQAFRLTGLTSIYCNAITPPAISSGTFEYVSKSIPIYVSASSVAAYKAAVGWKDFTNYNSLVTSVTEQGVNDVFVSTSISSFLKIENLEPSNQVELFNMNGALLIKDVAQGSLAEFNVESLSTGIYIVRVTQNGRAKSFKVIKK